MRRILKTFSLVSLSNCTLIFLNHQSTRPSLFYLWPLLLHSLLLFHHFAKSQSQFMSDYRFPNQLFRKNLKKKSGFSETHLSFKLKKGSLQWLITLPLHISVEFYRHWSFWLVYFYEGHIQRLQIEWNYHLFLLDSLTCVSFCTH